VKVGVASETVDGENRVALTPSVAGDLTSAGHEVYVASGAGTTSGFDDAAYEEAGCTVLDNRAAVFDRSDVVLQVRGLGAVSDPAIEQYRDGQIVIGLFGPYDLSDETLADLADREIDAFALEFIPRISRAQSMDALSSMASIGGYQATLMAATEVHKMFPMEMTAAGTIRPADVFVIGAGVAGLKAIATAERLGASVQAYDIRLEAREEVESLGADFVELDLETEGSGDDEGYAREMDEEFYRQQQKELTRVVAESDVVITTAAVPGKPAPELVTTEMIENMDPGSVIVDLSADTGGNCEPTQADGTVHHDGVTIFGPTDLPSRVAQTASEQYASNLANFLDNLFVDGDVVYDFEDEIIDSTLLTHDGTVRAPHQDDGEAVTDGEQRDSGGETGDPDGEETESTGKETDTEFDADDNEESEVGS
jgi:NAD(P) transhydrogenase subunit alpha